MKKLKVYKIPNIEATQLLIANCIKRQHEVLKLAKIDWNDPETRRSMEATIDI